MAGIVAIPCTVAILIAAGGGGSAGAAAAAAIALTQPSQYALTDIPPVYLSLYEAAVATCPGLPWTVLAGIGKVATNHGRLAGPSSTGGLGPMQIVPATLAQYGVDGDGDGIIDATNPADAIYTTTNLLCHNGAKDGSNIEGALDAYDHDDSVVEEILNYAIAYGGLTVGTGSATGAAQTAIAFAESHLGDPYVYGAEGPNSWDCSGLVQAAYAAAGVTIPRTTYQWAGAGPVVWSDVNDPGTPPAAEVEPGDLLYSAGSDGTPNNPGHVAMYIGNGQEIEAPHTGDVVKIIPVPNDISIVTRPAELGAGVAQAG